MREALAQGFVEVLEDFDDWLLDVPDGVAVMTLFICRAVVDEVLPPSFVARITPPPGSSLARLKDKCATTMAQPQVPSPLKKQAMKPVNYGFTISR